MPKINKIIYPGVPSTIIQVPLSDEFPHTVFHELPSDDVLHESFHSLMPMHYEGPEGEGNDIEHFIENSSDCNDAGIDDVLPINSTPSMAQPECFD